MAFFFDIEFAFTESVPQLDSAVTAATDDLSVVGGERNRENIGGVSDEAAGSEASIQVPKAKGVVP